MRGRHFKKEIKIIGKWRETKDFAHFSIQEDQRGTFKQNLKEVKPENIFPLFLNLVSCFLFMMNNYIIEPSSAYYAEALGSSDVSVLCISCVHIVCLISNPSFVDKHIGTFGYDDRYGPLVRFNIKRGILVLDKLQL